MADNPWDDPSLANDETKKIKARTAALKLKPLEPVTKPKPQGLTSMADDAFGKAGKFARRNKAVADATKNLRKALPGQGE